MQTLTYGTIYRVGFASCLAVTLVPTTTAQCTWINQLHSANKQHTFQLADLPGFIYLQPLPHRNASKYIPQSKDKKAWSEMNRMRITNKVTPLVSDARSLKAMSEVLTIGIYHAPSKREMWSVKRSRQEDTNYMQYKVPVHVASCIRTWMHSNDNNIIV